MCLSWVTLSTEMEFKPIQLKHQLCASIFLGTLFLLPTVRSRLRSNCSTSSSTNRKNPKIPLWNSAAQQASERLNDCFASSPILALPSMDEPFILYTDASQLPMTPSLPMYSMASSGSFATLPNLSIKPKVATRQSQNF